MATLDELKRLVHLETDVRYQEYPEQGRQEFTHISGRIPVLLSAPHGAVHFRQGAEKQEDEYTAGLVRLVGELTEAHVIYARRKSSTDPNWNAGVPYKRTLEKIVEKAAIRFILDLHGVAEHRKFGIAIGTLKGKSCPNHRSRIIRHFERSGFSREAEDILRRLSIDEGFTALGSAKQETITRFAWERLRVPAAQLELHPALRIVERRPDATEQKPYRGDPELIGATIETLVSLVDLLVA
jgi:hypothetical protein